MQLPKFVLYLVALVPSHVRRTIPTDSHHLANHGYLLRGGRNISVPMILDAALKGFNVDPDRLIVAAKFGLLYGNTPTTLDLDALALHSLIEHDASLLRGDFALGDNLCFNETIFMTLANANPGADNYNTTSHQMSSRSALSSRHYLGVMGNPLTRVAPKEFVQIFFREERMPIEEGWTRPTTSITRATLNALGAVIAANANCTVTQECEALVLGPDTMI
ncbi:Cloroperoxidase [Mycena olivaceomarginata]|nr:Cloroperoxidase [Mycena olivaceomarginata]